MTDTTGTEYSPALSTDGLTVFFQSDRSGGQGGFDLWFATRPTIADDFGPATNAGPVNTSANEIDPALSSDGLTLYFVSSPGTMNQLYRATRASVADLFGPGTMVPELANVEVEGPALSPRGDELFFSQGTGRRARGAGRRAGARSMDDDPRVPVTARFQPPARVLRTRDTGVA